MHPVLVQLAELRLIPLVVIDSPDRASPLGDALVDGGLPVAEVTFRTPAAEDAIQTLVERGDVLVGAGTCRTTDQVDRAIGAGAKFVVTPGTNPRVVEHALKLGVPIIPGVATSTEIEAAAALGIDHLKFFPAEPLGGIAMLQALAGPYPDVRFMPTGGISPELATRYLSNHSVFACGGSWLVPRELLTAGRFDAIRTLIEQGARLLDGVRR